MADATGIQWCDATFNPWVGCEKMSPGCAHCYAEKLVTGRMARPGTWGADGVRQRTAPSNWRKPLRWARLARDGRLPNGTENRDGHRPRVFCASLADVFEDRDELDPWRDDLLSLIYETPELDWLVLTKRPECARDYLGEAYLQSLPNLWLGVSIENARHTYRADVLRQIPAAVRFISAEPLLGSLCPPRCDARCFPMSYPGGSYVCGRERDHGGLHRSEYGDGAEWDADLVWIGRDTVGAYAKPLNLSGIDWVIVGGESGPDARPFHLEHAREIIAGARAVTNIRNFQPRVFVKQLGARPAEVSGHLSTGGVWTSGPMLLNDRKGGDWDEWPADLRIREFPRSAA